MDLQKTQLELAKLKLSQQKIDSAKLLANTAYIYFKTYNAAAERLQAVKNFKQHRFKFGKCTRRSQLFFRVFILIRFGTKAKSNCACKNAQCKI